MRTEHTASESAPQAPAQSPGVPSELAKVEPGAPAELAQALEHRAGAGTELAQADAAQVAKLQAANAAANATKQRGAAAAAKKQKAATTAKQNDGAVTMREARLKADRERFSLAAPPAEPAPYPRHRTQQALPSLIRPSTTGPTASPRKASESTTSPTTS